MSFPTEYGALHGPGGEARQPNGYNLVLEMDGMDNGLAPILKSEGKGGKVQVYGLGFGVPGQGLRIQRLGWRV